jgi:hypothetical protein
MAASTSSPKTEPHSLKALLEVKGGPVLADRRDTVSELAIHAITQRRERIRLLWVIRNHRR